MAWSFQIKAVARPRLIMRVAQIFDQQMLEIERFDLTREGSIATIHISVECDEPVVRRVHAKLYRLADLAHVDLLDQARPAPVVGEPVALGSPLYLDPLGPQP